VRFAGRRKAKEWNLIGALFDAATAERYDLVNRICAPADLEREVEKLCQVMLAKHPLIVRRTKFIMNKGADLHISGTLAFEVPIEPFAHGQQERPDAGTIGIRDFITKEGRERRRSLSRDFWQHR